MACHLSMDRYTAQMQRQRLMKRIAHAEETAAGYSNRCDSAQAAEWRKVADQARAELRALTEE